MSLNELMLSLELGLIYGVIAVGIYLSFRVINFADLTCDGSFVLGAAACSTLIKAGINPYIALLSALLAGGVAGLATGILHTKLKLSELLAGIIVAFMLYSVNLKVMQGMPNIVLLEVDTIFTNANPLVLLLIISVLVWLAICYVLNTDFGLAMRSIGQNKRLVLNGGVNLQRTTIICLVISNAIIAFGGALFSQHQGFADVSSGVGTIIIGLASVMIGERILANRSVWTAIISCILGSIIYRIIMSFALHSDVLGLETQDLNLITGLLVIVVMLLPRRSYASSTKY